MERPSCSDQLAFLTDPDDVVKILRHLGLPQGSMNQLEGKNAF